MKKRKYTLFTKLSIDADLYSASNNARLGRHADLYPVYYRNTKLGINADLYPVYSDTRLDIKMHNYTPFITQQN